MTIKRYDYEFQDGDEDHAGSAWMSESDNGEYVRYSDYRTLEIALEAIKAGALCIASLDSCAERETLTALAQIADKAIHS